MDTKDALKIAADRYDWSEDISAEIYTLIHRDLRELLQVPPTNELRDRIDEIDSEVISKYGFQPDWKLVENKPILEAYSISLPSYENTAAELRLRLTGIQGVVGIFVYVYDDRGSLKKSIDLGSLAAGKVEDTIAGWVLDVQEVAYYKQNNQLCQAAIHNILAGSSYPIEWIEGLVLDVYEWIFPKIGSIYSLKIGTPTAYPFNSIEVITLDRQAYYLPVSSVCRQHIARSTDELKAISPDLVDRFTQKIDGFVELKPKLFYQAIDRAIFKVNEQFSLKYEFYCPIPEIAAIACQNYL